MRPASKRFGDPAQTYRALRTALQSQPVTVTSPGSRPPVSRQHLEFGPLHLATVLRLATYTSEQAALLPLALDLAQRNGNYVPLAGQFLMMSRRVERSARVRHAQLRRLHGRRAVLSSPATIDRAQLAAHVPRHDAARRTARISARRGRAARSMRTCTRRCSSDVPVLLLSGGNDPVTPPAYAEQAKRGPEEQPARRAEGPGPRPARRTLRGSRDGGFLDARRGEGLDISCTQQRAADAVLHFARRPAP